MTSVPFIERRNGIGCIVQRTCPVPRKFATFNFAFATYAVDVGGSEETEWFDTFQFHAIPEPVHRLSQVFKSVFYL